jgi:AraC-like DNA-binding protein
MSHKCQSVLCTSRGRRIAELATVSADLPHGDRIPEHSHPEDQLLFASRGVMTLRTAQGTWVVPPMRAVWIPANTPHSVAISGIVHMRTLYLHPGLCRQLPRKCAVIPVSPLLRELVLRACTHAKLRKEVSVERRILECIVDQLQAVESIPLQLPHVSDPRARRIVESLSANPSDPRTLAALCKACGASKRTIQRLFLEETRMTFNRWRQQLRLLHALQLLASGEKVTVAALDSGYHSASAFIATFRKQLGATPARYLRTTSINTSPRPLAS